MVLSIHSAAFVSDAWPKTWPLYKLPPPSPLSEAAASLWSPQAKTRQQGEADSARAVVAAPSLYSTQLRGEGKAAPDGAQGHFEVALLDRRIALMRYDASHEAVAA